jgi:beta-lactamase class A
MTLTNRIESLAQTFTGMLGVSAINLTTHERFDYNAQQSFYPASTIKLPLLVETLRGVVEGRWQLDDPLILTAENVVSGSGVLCDLTPGLTLSVRDIATLMITVSDNTATNMLVDLCTTAALNQTMLEFGIQGVRMNRKIGFNVDEIALGEATPIGMARLMELIATRAILTPDACDLMLDMLTRQKYKELTNRFIAETDAEEGEPAVRIASKSGWIRGVRNDVALVWAPKATYVLSMYSQDCQDRRFYVDNEGALLLARVSQAVYEGWA